VGAPSWNGFTGRVRSDRSTAGRGVEPSPRRGFRRRAGAPDWPRDDRIPRSPGAAAKVHHSERRQCDSRGGQVQWPESSFGESHQRVMNVGKCPSNGDANREKIETDCGRGTARPWTSLSGSTDGTCSRRISGLKCHQATRAGRSISPVASGSPPRTNECQPVASGMKQDGAQRGRPEAEGSGWKRWRGSIAADRQARGLASLGEDAEGPSRSGASRRWSAMPSVRKAQDYDAVGGGRPTFFPPLVTNIRGFAWQMVKKSWHVVSAATGVGSR